MPIIENIRNGMRFEIVPGAIYPKNLYREVSKKKEEPVKSASVKIKAKKSRKKAKKEDGKDGKK